MAQPVYYNVRFTSYLTDAFNLFRYRGTAAICMDKSGIEAKKKNPDSWFSAYRNSEDEAFERLQKNLAKHRKNSQNCNRVVFGALTVISTFTLPLLAIPTAWRVIESFDRIPGVKNLTKLQFGMVDNPLKSEGLKPDSNYKQAEKIMSENYFNRFDNHIML